jgi:hypothetical protein
MCLGKKKVKEIVSLTAAKFPSFGISSVIIQRNPFSLDLKDLPPQFAGGVDIEKVVRFVLSRAR